MKSDILATDPMKIEPSLMIFHFKVAKIENIFYSYDDQQVKAKVFIDRFSPLASSSDTLALASQDIELSNKIKLEKKNGKENSKVIPDQLSPLLIHEKQMKDECELDEYHKHKRFVL